MHFCWNCGTKLGDEIVKYCPRCGIAIGTNKKPQKKIFLKNRNQFIVTSNLKDNDNIGTIMGTDQQILLYFIAKHTLKPLNGWWTGGFGKAEAKTADIRIESPDKALLGEIHEIPIYRTMTRHRINITRIWEIHRTKIGLEGIVREIPRFPFSSDWILENLAGETISSIRGNRKKKNYEILTKRKKPFAYCYQDDKIRKNSYYLDMQRFEIDPFLLLCYVIVLDRVKFRIRTKTSFKSK